MASERSRVLRAHRRASQGLALVSPTADDATRLTTFRPSTQPESQNCPLLSRSGAVYVMRWTEEGSMDSPRDPAPDDIAALWRLLASPERECRRAELTALVDATSTSGDVRRWYHALDTLVARGEMHPDMAWYLLSEVAMNVGQVWTETDSECCRLHDIALSGPGAGLLTSSDGGLQLIRAVLPDPLPREMAEASRAANEAEMAFYARWTAFEAQLLLAAGAIEMGIIRESDGAEYERRVSAGEALWYSDCDDGADA